MPRILVGTRDGLYDFDFPSGQRTVAHAGHAITDVAAEGVQPWAILDGSEIWRRAGDDRWSHLATLDGLSGNCIASTGAGILVGTAEARLFRVAGAALEAVSPFDEVGERSEWFTPWGGPPDTRSI